MKRPRRNSSVTKVVEYAFDKKESIDSNIVMDLYCGTGTIGKILASRSENAQIIGLDIVPSAIENAKENSQKNRIEGLKVYAADVGKFSAEHKKYAGKIRTIILDPARSGVAPKTMKKIINLGAERMVYVSYNPATQERDTEILA
ncbi:MAG: methyltransferase domain-containing protein [Bacteroidota bacterium]